MTNIKDLRLYGVNSFNLKDTSPEGSPYLDDEWKLGEVTLYNDVIINDCALKYDISKQSLLIKFEGKYFELPPGRVKRFASKSMLDSGSLSKRNFERIKSKKGEFKFIEVVEKGPSLILGKDHEVKYYRANYNVALDVGNSKPKYVKKTKDILYNGNDEISLKGSSKKIFKRIKDKDLKYFIREKNLDLSNTVHLIELIKNYKIIKEQK